jgi:hypothetical protein
MGVFRVAEQRGTSTFGHKKTGRVLAVNHVKYICTDQMYGTCQGHI